jgi:hypothetical protein
MLKAENWNQLESGVKSSSISAWFLLSALGLWFSFQASVCFEVHGASGFTASTR